MHVERIKFERTGGFAGMRIARDLTLDELPEEQANRILDLLDDMDFEELPEQLMSGDESSMPDQFTYVITVETSRGQHTVVTGDVSAPEKMQELLQLLNRLARTRKKQ
ncbi:MAG TPA: protealysin inhibitor emfourin [Anaerolineales bacterium]|nr:protealysin inhibitor emfourin [Anaerolineales bacterium]